MAGLTRYGLEIKRLPDIIEDRQQRARNIFADITPAGEEVDVGPNSALGRLIGLVSPAEADLWEAIQQIYDSFNPNAATGYALDNLVALSGITRLPATRTTAQVLLTGSVNTLIPTSVKVASRNTKHIFSLINTLSLTPQNASGIGVDVVLALPFTDYTVSYTTDNLNYIDITITTGPAPSEESILAALAAEANSLASTLFHAEVANGLLSIQRLDPFQLATFTVGPNLQIAKVSKLGVVRDDEIGPFSQPAGSIETISVPVAGLDSVINPLKATEGRFQETDEELRERFRNSKFFQARNILEALLDALRNVQGVEDVAIYENDTDDFNEILGIPAHSFMPVILGGLTTSVAEAIWQNKPTGIRSFGDTTVSIIDSQNLPHQISFRRPTEIPIYIKIVLQDIGGLAGDAATQIKQRILDHVKASYLIGDEVIYSRLYTPVNLVPGHAVNSLTIGTSPNPTGTSNITIDYDEVATFSLDRIDISVI